jgi:aminopeptidase N
MRLILVFVLLLTVVCCYGQQKVDVLHYRYDVILSDKNDTIQAVAYIHFKALEDMKTVSFDLASRDRDQRKGMKAFQVVAPGKGSFELPEYKHENNSISIDLPAAMLKGDTSSLAISYEGIPTDGLIITKNKFGRRGFFADNWPNRGHNWIACHDDPADKATVEFNVTAPEHYTVVANGVKVEEKPWDMPGYKQTKWKEETPISTKVMVIGVADFAVQQPGTVAGIPVYSYVFPENKDKGFHDYAMATDILPFFIKNIGPYGYKKLANVQSKTIFGGLENANTIFYAENSVTGDRRSESLITHEIAHQWFGNMATEKTFAHLWLSEGFATYMTVLYFEGKYGIDTATAMLKKDREEVIESPTTLMRPVVDETKDYMQLLNTNSYQKGGWILHMLRRQLSDSIFWKSIRSYYATYGGKTADTDDLRKIVETVSGVNLETFFKQWCYTPGIPKLKVEWKYMPGRKKIEVSVEQLQDNLFEFPLEIGLGDGNKILKVEKLNIKEKKQQFSFSAGDATSLVKLDPATSLLFTATVKQVN